MNIGFTKIASNNEITHIRRLLRKFKKDIGDKYDYFMIVGSKKKKGIGAEISSVPKKADPKKNAVKMHKDIHRDWAKEQGYSKVKW